MTRNAEPIVIRKNRKRAFWSLVIVLFFLPISGWLVYAGFRSGRPDVAWAMILFGLAGVVIFGGSAIRIVRTMRAPWHMEITPARMTFYTPTYDVEVPWELIAGIAVDEVNRKPGCVLVFEDTRAVSNSATFHRDQAARPDAVVDAQTMMTRMEENFDLTGYHLAIPGRLLEMGPDELAATLVQARAGELWEKEVV